MLSILFYKHNTYPNQMLMCIGSCLLICVNVLDDICHSLHIKSGSFEPFLSCQGELVGWKTLFCIHYGVKSDQKTKVGLTLPNQETMRNTRQLHPDCVFNRCGVDNIASGQSYQVLRVSG